MTHPTRTAVALVAALGLVASCSSNDKGSSPGASPSPTNQRTAAAAPSAKGGGKLRLTAATTPWGAQLTIDVTAPPGATEMQVGTDPTFTSTPWKPVADQVTQPVDGGYQEVFARFRGGPDVDPAATVAGLDVDLAAAAATSSTPAPALIGLADPRTLVVDVEVGRVERGTGTQGDTLRVPDVDPTALDSGWSLATGSTDAKITATHRSTIPTDTAHLGEHGDAGGDGQYPVRHRIDLMLQKPLTIGAKYELTSPLGTTSTFTIDDRSSRSPAVHANQVGYRPDDVSKRAYFSAPTGSKTAPAAPGFHVFDASGNSVFDGTAVKESLSTDGEVGQGDLTGQQVWSLDFSSVTTPGRYRVCIDAVGCSETFAVDDTGTWLRVATTVARGLYHQRSGTTLGPPYTAVSRPRPDHPDDGLVVHQSKLTALEAADLPDDQLFSKLVAGSTDTVVKGAWGGHSDAGDWDRRTQHLFAARELLDLVRIAPDRFAHLDLNIPESGDSVPDIADEAFWTLDLFHRLQRPDGAVGGGIEGARFPDFGVASWTDDLARYAYAPDPWTTYAYASVAADAAVALRDIDPDRSKSYADSAAAAMTWAEAQTPTAKYADKIKAQQAVAAASMLALTGDARYNRMFLDDTPFAGGTTDQLGCNVNEICDAAWNYLWVDRSLTDPTAITNIETTFVDKADALAKASDSTLYGWCLEDPGVPLIWGLGVGGAPHAITLLRAYLIGGDRRFLADAQRCASVTLGANPLDVSYITGIGANPARHPLIVDVNSGGHLPVWPGTPVYGNHRLPGETDWAIQYRLKPAGITGDPYTTPYMQSWYDLADVGPLNEFTVYQSHGPAIWVFGVLASGAPRSPGR